jgi:hypothetical protein
MYVDGVLFALRLRLVYFVFLHVDLLVFGIHNTVLTTKAKFIFKKTVGQPKSKSRTQNSQLKDS